MTTHVVPDSVQEITLARYLSRAWPMTPAWVFREALKKKDVRVNGVRSSGDAVVRGGDNAFDLRGRHVFYRRRARAFRGKRHADRRKTRGLPVDEDGQNVGCDTLLSRVQRTHPSARLCHRLDAGTGGPVAFSLTDEAHERLRKAFSEHRAEKIYQCVVKGCPEKREASLTHYLVKDARASFVRAHDKPVPGALEAKMRYRVLREGKGVSLVEATLFTGRTHQIRAQMAAIGHPLLGDDKYGDRQLNKALRVTQPQLWCVRLRIEGAEASPRRGLRRNAP
jgi:16S rRNA U516 pseudouridylate synthase RsuA-like enzyme